MQLGEPCVRELRHSRIPIPWASGQPRLDTTLECWLYTAPPSAGSPLVELLLTPIQKQYWEDLWEITLTAREQPGILARLARHLGDRGVNIVLAKTITCSDSRFHINRLLVDCRRYRSHLDADWSTRLSADPTTLTDLRRDLLVEFIEELHFARRNSPSLSIARHSELWSLVHSGSPDTEARLPVTDGTIELPADLLNTVSQIYAQRYNLTPAALRRPIGLISVGDRLDVMRISILYPNSGFAEIAITTTNRPGAIGEVAQALWATGFNILGMRAWSSSAGRRTTCWLIVQRLARGALSSEQVVKEIEEVLGGNEVLRHYEPQIEQISSVL